MIQIYCVAALLLSLFTGSVQAAEHVLESGQRSHISQVSVSQDLTEESEVTQTHDQAFRVYHSTFTEMLPIETFSFAENIPARPVFFDPLFLMGFEKAKRIHHFHLSLPPPSAIIHA